MRITYELLEEHGACGEAEVFREYFPNGVNVTPALCVEYAEDFDWTWAARHLLTTDHQRAQYDALYDNAARQRQNDTSDIAHLATSNGEYTTRVSELTRILHRRLARAFGELASERPLSTFDTPFTDDEVNPEPSTSKDVTPASESAAKPTTPSESVASAHVEFVPLDSNIGVIQRAITNMQEAMTNIVDTEVETLPSGRPARMTHQMVLSHNPCAFGYQRFVDAYPESEYPDGIPVTVPVLRRHAESVDVEWLAGRFFSGYGSPTMGRFHQLNLNIFTRYQEDERHSVGGTGIDAQRARRKLYFDRRARAFVELYRGDPVTPLDVPFADEATSTTPQTPPEAAGAPSTQAELPHGRSQFITISTARVHGACSSGLRELASAFPHNEFPDGAPVTMEAVLPRARRIMWSWAAEQFLSPAELTQYNRVWRDSRDLFRDERTWSSYEECEARYYLRLARAFVELYRGMPLSTVHDELPTVTRAPATRMPQPTRAQPARARAARTEESTQANTSEAPFPGKRMKHLTQAMLDKHNACSPGQMLWRRAFPPALYPKGAPMTVVDAVRYADQIDWVWMRRLLRADQRDEFTSIMARMWHYSESGRINPKIARAFIEMLYDVPLTAFTEPVDIPTPSRNHVVI